MNNDTEQMLHAYIICALWSSIDENDVPLDTHFSKDNLAPETLQQMRQDVENFYNENFKDIKYNLVQAGHDLWLTRNGHGAGFWDGDWEKKAGQRLTQAAKQMGGCDLYTVNDQIFIL